MDALEKMRRSFEGHLEHSEATAIVLLAIVALAVLGLTVQFFFSESARRIRAQRRLFQQFSDAQELTGSERALMWKAARLARLEDPTLIFVRRSQFEEAAREPGEDRTLVSIVRQKVYGP